MTVEYWELSELNIFKTGKDSYQLISSDGTIAEISEKDAKLIFLIPGVQDIRRLQRDAQYYGFEMAIEEIQELLEILKELFLLKVVSWVPIQRFNPDRSIHNLSLITKGPVALASLTFSLTEACPYTCNYCYRKELRKNSINFNRLPQQMICDAIHDAAQLGARLIEFSGGEPALVADEICLYANIAKSMGIPYLGVISSGGGLTSEIIQKWLKSGINQLNIKVDYWDENLQDCLCGQKGAWSRAIQSIKTGINLGASVRILTTYFGQDLSHIDDIAKFAQEIGVRKHVIGVAVPLGDSAPLSPEKIKTCASHVRELGMTYHVANMALIDYEGSFSTPMICPAGITRVSVDPTGIVTGCPMLEGFHSAGHLQKSGLREIWVNGEWTFLRNSRVINSKCANCEIRAYCIGNCFAFGQALFKDPEMYREHACYYDRMR